MNLNSGNQKEEKKVMEKKTAPRCSLHWVYDQVCLRKANGIGGVFGFRFTETTQTSLLFTANLSMQFSHRSRVARHVEKGTEQFSSAAL